MDTVQAGQVLHRAETGAAAGGQIHRGILSGIKADELPPEAFNEFSNAPFEFENTALMLWEDTRRVYYHACTANRFSEHYLTYCTLLEKNIRQLGSFCLTKAVLEQNGIFVPKLAGISIGELIEMVSFHLRKAHAALEGIYQDNHLLGVTYLSWEFRWAALGNRLKATGAKIRQIREGKIDTEAMLKKAGDQKEGPRTNSSPDPAFSKSLRLSPNALPVQGSIARKMIREEKEAAKEKMREERRKKQELRRNTPRGGFPGAFGAPAPFRPSKEDMEWLRRKSAESRPQEPDDPKPPAETRPPDPDGAKLLTEAEARKFLIERAMKAGDQEAVRMIPLEDTAAFYQRWVRFTKEAEYAHAAPARGPTAEKRKELREKRKKKKGKQ